ncbi:MAG: hypothetical protein LGB07_02410 [Sulfurovum sp.]|nr:hypothetical protein [Sulfurovum sp.]
MPGLLKSYILSYCLHMILVKKQQKSKTKSTRRFVYWSEPGVEQRGHNSDLLFLPRYTKELLVHRDVLAAHVKTVEPIVA